MRSTRLGLTAILLVAALALLVQAAAGAPAHRAAAAKHPKGTSALCHVTTSPFSQKQLWLKPKAALKHIHKDFLDYRGLCGTGRAKIVMIKKVLPNGDPGVFNLYVNGRRLAHDTTSGDSTQPLYMLPGWNTIYELAGDSTSLDDYLSSWSCVDHLRAYKQSGKGPTARIFVSKSRLLSCTMLNVRRANVTVKKVTAPASDAGQFDFAIAGNTVGTGGNGFSSQPTTVAQAPVLVSEAAHPGTDMSTYTSSYVCTDNGVKASSGDGVSVSLTAQDGHSYVCVFTNSKKPATPPTGGGGGNPTPTPTGTIELKKVVPGEGNEGQFNLILDGQTVAQGGNGADSGSKTVTAGSHTVQETAQAGTDLADYSAAYSCTAGETVVKSGSGTTFQVAVSANQAVVCTLTNTPGQGTLAVAKQLRPTTDEGRFDLSIDDSVVKAQASNGDSSDPQTVAAGTHTISESSNPEMEDNPLSWYVSSYQCYDQNENLVAQGPGTEASVHVHVGQQVACTFTNTRGAGSVTLVKHLVPADDPGRFDLYLNGQQVVCNAGDGDSSGAIAVVSGFQYFSENPSQCYYELVKPLISLQGEQYTTHWSCVDSDTQRVLSAGDGTEGGVPVDAGQAVTCTFTNTVDSTIDVMKSLNPADDAGRFDLLVDGSDYAAACGNGCGTETQDGPAYVAPGDHTVSEIVNGDSSPEGLSLDDYTTTYSCLDGETVVSSGDGTSADVTTTAGQHVSCTFTNTRKGYVTVSKQTVPEDDPGTFNLQVNGQTVASGGNGTTSAPVAVPAGGPDAPTFTVGETAGEGTSLDDYTAQTECIDQNTEQAIEPRNDGSYNAPQPGQNISCIITNTRDATIELKKTVVVAEGSQQPQNSDAWDFFVNQGNVDTGGAGFDKTVTVEPGQYSVSESPTGAMAQDAPFFTAQISCVEDGQEIGTISNNMSYGPFTVDPGEHYTCTFTNTYDRPLILELGPSQ